MAPNTNDDIGYVNYGYFELAQGSDPDFSEFVTTANTYDDGSLLQSTSTSSPLAPQPITRPIAAPSSIFNPARLPARSTWGDSGGHQINDNSVNSASYSSHGTGPFDARSTANCGFYHNTGCPNNGGVPINLGLAGNGYLNTVGHGSGLGNQAVTNNELYVALTIQRNQSRADNKADLEEIVSKKIDPGFHAVGEINQRLTGICGRIEGLDQSVAGYETHLLAIKSRMDAMQAEIDRLQANAGALANSPASSDITDDATATKKDTNEPEDDVHPALPVDDDLFPQDVSSHKTEVSLDLMVDRAGSKESIKTGMRFTAARSENVEKLINAIGTQTRSRTFIKQWGKGHVSRPSFQVENMNERGAFVDANEDEVNQWLGRIARTGEVWCIKAEVIMDMDF